MQFCNLTRVDLVIRLRISSSPRANTITCNNLKRCNHLDMYKQIKVSEARIHTTKVLGAHFYGIRDLKVSIPHRHG